MANQELSLLDDPFCDIGNHVYGERFVGRQDHVRQLQDRCTSANWSVQGLPHTGKTSLVWHSIVHNKASVKAKCTLCVAYFCVDECQDLEEFYSTLATQVYESVKDKLVNETEKNTLDNVYHKAQNNKFSEADVKNFFIQGIKSLKISVVIIMDRFDYVIKLGARTKDLSTIRALLVPNVHVVIISIQSINSIENKIGKEGGSILEQLFSSTIIALSQYDQHDMEQYWERLKPYYEKVGLTLDDNYKRNAQYYAGNDPFLLDTYNNDIYNSKLYRRDNSSLNKKLSLTRLYESSIKALEREGLLDTAIQAILGPVYDIDEYKMDMLQQLDFLRIVSENVKLALVGHSMGQIDLDPQQHSTIAYVAKTDYFTKLFKKAFLGKAEFWKEWSATFRSLQLLCENFLQEKWGGHWSEHVEEEAITQMLADAKLDEKAGITVSPLIDYLRETSIGILIDKYWGIFAPVFNPIGRYTFKEHYGVVKSLRNHHAHNNTRFLSESDKALANEYLEEIGRKVNAWHQSGKKLLTSVTVTTTPVAPVSKPVASVPKPVAPVPKPAATAVRPVIPVIADKPKPVIDLGLNECLGKIYHQTKDSVNIVGRDNLSWTRIDRLKGYRDGCSLREIDYQEGEWVVCKLKTVIKSGGKTSYYVIDIHPADDEG